MTPPIKLFWFNNKPNFGDALSPAIVESISKRKVVWASPQDATLFSTGSLYDFIRERGVGGPPGGHVWGSGTLGPMKKPFWRGVTIHAQRGPLTRLTTLSAARACGDPALLYPLVYSPDADVSETAIFIPHMRHVAKAKKYFEERNVPGLKLVNPATSDHRSIVEEIAAARLVFSSSLHGLILADAFSRPNIWVDPTGIHRWPKWKFIDYFFSVRRPVRRPVSIEEIPALLNNEYEFDVSLTKRIEARRRQLVKSFPDGI